MSKYWGNFPSIFFSSDQFPSIVTRRFRVWLPGSWNYFREYLRENANIFENILGCELLIHEKKHRSNLSCYCPFKFFLTKRNIMLGWPVRWQRCCLCRCRGGGRGWRCGPRSRTSQTGSTARTPGSCPSPRSWCPPLTARCAAKSQTYDAHHWQPDTLQNPNLMMPTIDNQIRCKIPIL